MNQKPSFIKSVQCALQGFWWVLRHERNFQIEIGFLLINILLIIILRLTKIDILLVLICSFLVLSAELLNTAIEKLCDFIHPNQHMMIGLVKDISAAFVLCLTLLSVVVGIWVYFPYFHNYFQTFM